MVHGINGTGNVNNDIKIELNKVTQSSAQYIGSSFGDGFAENCDYLGITRTIAGLDDLGKTFAHISAEKAMLPNGKTLYITDKDYIPDGNSKEIALQEA